MSRSRFVLLAGLIVLLAATLRLVLIGQIPPGLHFDEAANGVIVRGIAYEGARPLFITAYTGKEVLWFYLAALTMRLLGPTALAMRVNSALIGTLTVGATGWLVRELYADDERRDWLALLGMAILAVAFWHGVLSRLAFRAISQPLMQALGLVMLWRGLRSVPGKGLKPLVWLILGGLATGLTAYTYLAARLFPIPLAVTLAALLIADRRHLGRRLAQVGAFGAAALATFAPLGLYFVRNPAAFAVRIDQVRPASIAEALDGWQRALGMFFVSGDPLWRFNLPGKPLFGPFLGAAFVVGVGVALVELIRARDPLNSARGALLAIWPLAMLAPTALATGSITPSNLRAVGLAPLVALYPALGLVALLRWTTNRRYIAPGAADKICVVLLVLILAVGGSLTARDTLVGWGRSATLYYDNDAHVAALARYLNGPHPAGTIYAVTPHYQHPTLAFLADDYGALRTLFGYYTRAFVLASEGPTLIAYTRDAPPPPEWAEALAPYLVAAPPGPDGTPDFWVYHLSAGADLPVEFEPLQAAFGDMISLEGAAVHPAKSGGDVIADLAWHVLAHADQPDYAVVAQICDAWGWCWGWEPARNDAYPSKLWTPGEQVLTRLAIPLPAGAPPGDYTLRIGLYSAEAGVRLPLLDAGGAFAGTYAEVGPIRAARADAYLPASELPIQHRERHQITPGLTLLGYDRANDSARTGERLRLALYWRAGEQIDAAGQVTISLDDGTTLYQGVPVHGTYPMSEWVSGEVVVDRYDPHLPHDLAGGDYRVLLSVDGSPPVDLGPLHVEAVERAFMPPPDMTPLDPQPTLGGQITLLGYRLASQTLAPGEELALSLVWQAETEIEGSYTVFVHLADGSGQIAAQHDAPPQNGAYPTDLWLPGEVVDDTHTLSLPVNAPPGDYTLQVGLYLQASGKRLPAPGWPDGAITLPVKVRVGP
jgi:hypothetical protein